MRKYDILFKFFVLVIIGAILFEIIDLKKKIGLIKPKIIILPTHTETVTKIGTTTPDNNTTDSILNDLKQRIGQIEYDFTQIFNF